MPITIKAVTGSLLIAVLGLGVIACSGGGRGTTPTIESTPEVSMPSETSSPSESSTGDFANAVEFTRLVHIDEFGTAGSLVADNSSAALYIAHQNAVQRVNELHGQASKRSETDVIIDGDEETGSIRIELSDTDEPTTYTWKDFKFGDNGKIASWTGKSGPIDKILWHQGATAKTRGVTVKLISAYVANNGTLIIVAELTSTNRAIRVTDATYTPKSGYRQQDSANYYTEVDKEEKALTMFQFSSTKLDGKLRLKIGHLDPNDSSSSYELGTATLIIK